MTKINDNFKWLSLTSMFNPDFNYTEFDIIKNADVRVENRKLLK